MHNHSTTFKHIWVYSVTKGKSSKQQEGGKAVRDLSSVCGDAFLLLGELLPSDRAFPAQAPYPLSSIIHSDKHTKRRMKTHTVWTSQGIACILCFFKAKQQMSSLADRLLKGARVPPCLSLSPLQSAQVLTGLLGPPLPPGSSAAAYRYQLSNIVFFCNFNERSLREIFCVCATVSVMTLLLQYCRALRGLVEAEVEEGDHDLHLPWFKSSKATLFLSLLLSENTIDIILKHKMLQNRIYQYQYWMKYK